MHKYIWGETYFLALFIIAKHWQQYYDKIKHPATGHCIFEVSHPWD